MLLWNLNLLLRQPLTFLVVLAATSVALLITLTIHEFSHALVADRLGDNTSRRLGRLSLNPLAHLDPVGTAMLFLVGFGWGKPVPVNQEQLRGGGRSGMAKVALAGPASNLLAAALFALPFRIGMVNSGPSLGFGFGGGVGGMVSLLLEVILFYNLVLALFNLLPIPPLDGFRVALGLLPRGQAYALARQERWGPFILLGIIGLGWFTPLDLLSNTLLPAVEFAANVLTGGRF
ncbi:MAG: site-2 protease family protein [Chloroflexi bacterium]|nr:site-2 protease family protein [Chloroflexota bacterium]